ncbi:MAG: 2-oxo acid dehydrogenase subunit E2 [Firmicutes bacterium]|nr:2-oxo acid dehydrogenase subunit E2 [Bacillota bacterium]
MPLFRRSDGDLVRDEAPLRRFMPYLLRNRSEACIFQESIYRIALTREWLKAYNRAHEAKATLFHLVAYACVVALEARPRLNRFVSGGRLYQRKGVFLSFVAKTEFTDRAPGATVKLERHPAESFAAFSRRMADLVGEARHQERSVDREVAFMTRLPGPVLRLVMAVALRLDQWNLFPAFMIRPDPMFTSLFLANLGSVGVSDAFHHLYEYGNASIFGAVSAPRRTPFATRDGAISEEALSVRWTFDERIDDAFSCAHSLELVKKILEDPEHWLGPADGDPVWKDEDAGSSVLLKA